MQWAWDAAAVVSAGIAMVFILTRRRMLSGAHTTWYSASGLVQAVLAIQAIYMGCVAISILFGGGHASPRETVAYAISAVVAVVFTLNLDRTGRRPREEIRADIDALMRRHPPASYKR